MKVHTAPNRFKQVAKNLKIGAFLYEIYYAPKGFLQKVISQGAINMAIDYQARLQMEAAAYRLKTVNNFSSNSLLNIHFLSGKNFWYQTCFCAYSMMQQAQRNLRPVIYDDGTLEKKYVKEIKRIFPHAKIISIEEIEDNLNQHLPINKFPYLWERRVNYPNMRKLTDIHIGSRGWKLVLDSDMLFFRTPTFLLNWLESSQEFCYMVDVENSYGYSEALMTSLAAMIGIGNLAGVSAAIAIGGMGSLFWLWVIALLGMATKFGEAVLAVKFLRWSSISHFAKT